MTARRTIILTAFLIAAIWTHSLCQNINPQEFYIGSAEGTDIEAVRAAALKDLTTKIQVLVSASSFRKTEENNRGISDSVSLQVITRSAMNLTEVDELPVERLGKNRVRIVKFVSKENVKKLFNTRRQKILEHLASAESEIAAANGGIHLGQILKHLGSAYLLTRLYPDTITFSYRDRAGGEQLSRHPDVYISSRLQTLISSVNITPLKKEYEDKGDKYAEWLCEVKRNGQKVTSMEFEYFDGSGRSICQVNNGTAKIILYYPDSIKDTRVNASPELFYEEEPDEELQAAMEVFSARFPVPEIQFTIPANQPATASAAVTSLLPKTDQTAVPEPVPQKPNSSDAKPTEQSSPVPPVKLPQTVQRLTAAKLDGEGIVRLLALLEKENRLIKGRADMFESLNGLYGVVIDTQGIAALLVFKNGKYLDAQTGTEVDFTRLDNKRITWIEVLD